MADFRQLLVEKLVKTPSKKIDTKKEEDYTLQPQYDSRNSFYGKAEVKELPNGDKELYSYGTHVGGIKDGKPYTKGRFSQTTSRHQKEFFKQHNFEPSEVKEESKVQEDLSYGEIVSIQREIEAAMERKGGPLSADEARDLAEALGAEAGYEGQDLEDLINEAMLVAELPTLEESKDSETGMTIRNRLSNLSPESLERDMELFSDKGLKLALDTFVEGDMDTPLAKALKAKLGITESKKITEDLLDNAYNRIEDSGLEAVDLLAKVIKFFGAAPAEDFVAEMFKDLEESKNKVVENNQPLLDASFESVEKILNKMFPDTDESTIATATEKILQHAEKCREIVDGTEIYNNESSFHGIEECLEELFGKSDKNEAIALWIDDTITDAWGNL